MTPDEINSLHLKIHDIIKQYVSVQDGEIVGINMAAKECTQAIIPDIQQHASLAWDAALNRHLGLEVAELIGQSTPPNKQQYLKQTFETT